PRVGQHARVRLRAAAKKKSRSPVCGTQESDWSASGAPTEVEVRAGAVLPSGGRAEHQATGAVPQPADQPCSISPCLVEAKEEKTWRWRCSQAESPYYWRTFSTATGFYAKYLVAILPTPRQSLTCTRIPPNIPRFHDRPKHL